MPNLPLGGETEHGHLKTLKPRYLGAFSPPIRFCQFDSAKMCLLSSLEVVNEPTLKPNARFKAGPQAGPQLGALCYTSMAVCRMLPPHQVGVHAMWNSAPWGYPETFEFKIAVDLAILLWVRPRVTSGCELGTVQWGGREINLRRIGLKPACRRPHGWKTGGWTTATGVGPAQIEGIGSSVGKHRNACEKPGGFRVN